MRKAYGYFLKIFLTIIIISIAVGMYLLYSYSRDLPDYTELINYCPSTTTRIYSEDGKLIEEYSKEKRIFVPIKNIPIKLIQAIVAAEDKNFFKNQGIEIFSIVRAAINNIFLISSSDKKQGGSTITQQVVKNILLTPKQHLKRKIQEAMLSYMVSKIFDKSHILELYLNQIYLGNHSYGVATAALNYFDKSLSELTLEEVAFIAALPKSPSLLNPKKNYELAKGRRNYILKRMFEEGYITKEEYEETIKTDIITKKRDRSNNISAPYYVDQVRKEAIKLLGKELFYTGGFTIITGLSSEHQKHALSAFRFGIEEYDKKRGFCGVISNINLDHWQKELKNKKNDISLLDRKLAVILDIDSKKITIGLENGEKSFIQLKNFQWALTQNKKVYDLFKKGDVILVKLLTDSSYSLEQTPEVNGAIIVMEPKIGKVLAMVGGYDYESSSFNRATQAYRQTGSAVKSTVYLTALESGIAPNTIFFDEPIKIYQGPGLALWEPKNFPDRFSGPITMRQGLEESKNIITIKVAKLVGVENVINMLKKLDIVAQDYDKNFFSVVLGAVESTLLNVSTAYAIIANQGYKVTPSFIELIQDHKGNVVYKRDNREFIAKNNKFQMPKIIDSNRTRIIDKASAYQMVSMLEGAVVRGTSRGAKFLNKHVANKTGTTNDNKDAWSIGFTPNNILVGVYVGYDIPKTLGQNFTGSKLALPIVVNFLKQALKNVPSIPFKIPKSIILKNINPDTGEISNDPNSITEAFKKHQTMFIPIIQNNGHDNTEHSIFELSTD